ncbi:helix-turn-helix domain-containing protein [Mariniflexile litorale]|uniref:Helix-turn-helix domain-containing protein n=1 Tax=Mariniflexile litorale TaxID=3045158 RepID=A0AAU7EEU8_9FLAO|nr:helix-turn-helix domain-containing protein [Mariniflexile sp. KMM 9835]MDQ8213585.1 helix-turn-helix domain-containing protein [Mariniflexile sp. KMM 9835]
MKNKNLAKKVKELRRRKGFSQEELTENSGLSLRTIQRIENGETEPTGETLKRISNALNVSPEELIDWTIVEDNGFLKAMNLSALTFILFPLLGILVPLIMWISKKDKLKNINIIGKNILNFQITWTIILFVGFIINSIILAKDFDSKEVLLVNSIISSQKRILIFFLIMYGINAVLIIVNTFRIQKNKEVFYQPKINFIRN